MIKIESLERFHTFYGSNVDTLLPEALFGWTGLVGSEKLFPRVVQTKAFTKFPVDFRMQPELFFWVVREIKRFELGPYRLPNFYDEVVPKLDYSSVTSEWVFPEFWFHFPHVSLDDPSMIAYTPSHEYGVRDRQVKVKIGRYLTQFYGDKLTPEQIKTYSNMTKSVSVQFAKTRDEIRFVYENGPGSCMAGDEFDISGSYHPAEVYSGEFECAYIENARGDIVARGLVHNPSKTWVRVYGDEADTLADHLNIGGFKKALSWVGAKLLYIEDDDGDPIMAYLDGEDKDLEKEGEYWVVTHRGEFTADHTNGLLHTSKSECDECGERSHEDDLMYSEYYDRSFCSHCLNNGFTFAHYRNGEEYLRDDDVVRCESDDEYYENSDQNLLHHDLVWTHDGKLYAVDECVVIQSTEEWAPMDDCTLIDEDEGLWELTSNIEQKVNV